MTMDYGTILELRDLHSALKRHNGGYFFPKVVVKYSNLCNHLSSEGHLQVCMCVWVRVSVVKYSNLCDFKFKGQFSGVYVCVHACEKEWVWWSIQIYLTIYVQRSISRCVCMRKSECGKVFKFMWLSSKVNFQVCVRERAWTDLCHIFLTSTGL